MERSKTDKGLRLTNGEVSQIDRDNGQNRQDVGEEESLSYNNTIHIETGLRTDDLESHRFTFEIAQLTEMRDYKKDELDKIKADRTAADGVYMGMQPLQTLISQAKTFRDEIELAIVEKDYLNMNIEELDKTADDL